MSSKYAAKLMIVVALLFQSHLSVAQTNFRGLIILIDFSDAPANVTAARANNLMNGVGYTEAHATSSVRDYWYRQSRGKINFTHDVVGYFRAPQPASWYNSQPFIEYINLLTQALNWLTVTQPGFNWNGLSMANGNMNRRGDEEGSFLSVSFSTTAWIPGTGGTHDLNWNAPNGAHTKQVVGSTFIAPWDVDVNLFWITHEMGHMVWGWPDTYDYTGLSAGTGDFSLMSGNQGTGDIEPPGGPFIVQENWVNTIDITDQHIILPQDGNTMARFRNPFDPKEYFIIEARMRSTIGNAALHAERGLLIWHVDENVTTANIYPQMTPTQHYRVSIEQADGLFNMEHNINRGDAGDIYIPGKVFNDLVLPNANWWSGNASTLSISNIQLLGNNKISFNASNNIVCSAGNSNTQKIIICHNGNALCVPMSNLSVHLAHGDLIGECSITIANPLYEFIPAEKAISIYPNPNRGALNIELNLSIDEIENSSISVINASGQIVKQIGIHGQQKLYIGIDQPGIYILRLHTPDRVINKRFMVLKD